MTKTHKNRLTKLSDFLKTSFNKKGSRGKLSTDTDFHMGHWAQGGFKEQKCGTSACALGWATTLFPRILRLIDHGQDEHDKDNYNVLAAEMVVEHKRTKKTGVQAGMEIFGITNPQGIYLFGTDGYGCDSHAIQPKQVAKRIDKIIKNPEFKS